MSKYGPMGTDFRTVTKVNPDITVELFGIVNRLILGQRLPNYDHIVDVCRCAIREIERLRAAQPPKPEDWSAPNG